MSLVQDEVKTVTITSRGNTVAEVIKQVTEQSQVKVYAGDVAKLPVIIKVTDMPTKAFLETLADAVGASWVKEGENLVMRWNTSLSAATSAAERDKRMERLNTNVKNWDKQNAHALDWSKASFQKRIDETNARIKQVEGKSRGEDEWVYFGNGGNPAMLVLQEAIKKLPRKEIVDLGPNERVVYSTSPNEFQRALPYAPTSIGAFIEARGRTLEAIKQFRKSAFYRIYSGISREQEKNIDVADLLVRVANQSRRGEYVRVDILMANSKGEVVGQAATTISALRVSSPPAAIPKGKVKLRPESVKLSMALTRGNRYAQATEYDVAYPSTTWKFDKETAPIEPLLRDPVKNEPISFAVADAFFDLAEQLKKDMIAYIPDPVALRAMQRATNVNANFENLFGEAHLSGCQIENGNILFAGTTGSEFSGEGYADRTAIAGLVEKVRTQKYLRFKDIGDYVAERGEQVQVYDMDYHYVMACAPTIAAQISQLSPNTLKVYRSAGIKIETAMNGQFELPIDMWAAPIRTEFIKMITRGQFRIYGQGMTELQQQEPTESYTMDMADRVALRAITTSQDAAWAVDSKGDGRFLYAYQLGARNSPRFYDHQQQQNWPKDFVSFKPAQVKACHLSFVIKAPITSNANVSGASGVSVAVRSRNIDMVYGQTRSGYYEAAQGLQSISELTMIGDKELPLDQFPAGFLKQVEQARKQQGPIFSKDQIGYKPVIPPQP